MRFSSVESIRWPPGRVVRWELSSAMPAVDVDVAPSENERFHVEAFERSGTAGWLAVSIDMPVPIATDDIGRAILGLIRRHEILRCHFSLSDNTFRRMKVPADAVGCVPVEADTSEGDDDAAAVMARAIEAGCSPTRPLSHQIASIHRSDTTTIILGFDHCYVDAYSLAIIAREIADDLSGEDCLDGTGSTFVDSVFLDHRRAEESAPPLSADDPRLLEWGAFLASTDWEVPTFPLDLGLDPGEKAPMRTELHSLLDAEGAALFRKAMHGRGIRSFPALLTATATATATLGGPDELPMVLPVRTRFGRHHLEAIGWMVGNAPITVHTAADPLDACHTNTAALNAAIPLAEVDLTSVYRSYGDRIRRRRDDVFMVSYVDYNRLPIPDHVAATHISGSRPTDTAQWWYSHDDAGVGVRVRYPDTSVAVATMRDLTALITEHVATFTHLAVTDT